MTTTPQHLPSSPGPAGGRPPGGILEVVLLLPDTRVAALEARARAQGLSLGELLRHLIDRYLDDEA